MKHVSHPTNTRTLQAPKGWNHDDLACDALPVTDMLAGGLPCVVSFWQLERGELQAIAAGHPVVLSIVGSTMPPVALAVDVDRDAPPPTHSGVLALVQQRLDERDEYFGHRQRPEPSDEERRTLGVLRQAERELRRIGESAAPSAGARDEALMKLSQFAHTSAHMSEREARNNLLSIADQLIALAQPAPVQQPQRPLADDAKQRLNPYELSGSSRSIWLSGFAAAEKAHGIVADTSAVDAAFPAEPFRDPPNGYCTGCGGSGEQMHMTGRGPDTHEELGACDQCGGTGGPPVQRDAWRGGSTYEASMLRNLLARVHGDGGHYVEQYGLEKALEDADLLVATWRATPAPQDVREPSEAAALAAVMLERRRQVDVKGWTPEHDDGHVNDEIAALACFYAMPPGAREWPATETGYGHTLGAAIVPQGWEAKEGDRWRELVKAGALILAEAARLDRAERKAREGRESNTDATCRKCGCTDSRACAGGCSWLWVDREACTGLCSSCAPEITAEEVQRDELGQWWHSALDDLPGDTSYAPLLAAAGLEHVVVTRDEAPQSVQERLEAGWDGDFSFWDLQPPEGHGWFLIGAYDTEDGPVQCWARPTLDKQS